MNKTGKRKLKERIYSYIFDMKKGEEDKVARRIVDDVELLLINANSYQHSLELEINRLNKEIKQ